MSKFCHFMLIFNMLDALIFPLLVHACLHFFWWIYKCVALDNSNYHKKKTEQWSEYKTFYFFDFILSLFLFFSLEFPCPCLALPPPLSVFFFLSRSRNSDNNASSTASYFFSASLLASSSSCAYKRGIVHRKHQIIDG